MNVRGKVAKVLIPEGWVEWAYAPATPPSSSAAELALYDLLKCVLEVLVEVGVNDRVEQRVGVAQPVDYGAQQGGHVAAAFAEGQDQGHDEEGQPAEDEGAHDDAQRLHRLPLAGQGHLTLGLGVALIFLLEGGGDAGDSTGLAGQRQVLFGVAHPVHFDHFQGGSFVALPHGSIGARSPCCLVLHARPPVFATRLTIYALSGLRGWRRPKAVVGYLLLLLLDCLADAESRGSEDAPVENQHEQQRDVESAKGGVNSVAMVLADGARVGVRAVFRGTPAQHGRDGDEEANEPGERDECSCAPGRPLVHVVDGVCDGPVPVQRDSAQVQDGRGAAQHVEGDEQVTGDLSQSPLIEHLVQRGHGQHQHRHHEVCDGQRAYKIVRHVLQGALQGYGGHHARIAQHRAEDERAQQQRGDHLVAEGHVGDASSVGACPEGTLGRRSVVAL